MNEEMSDLPQAETADPDGVQVALRAAQALWSSGETSESLKWLRKAAESASDEGADVRSLQLAKAAAELRAKLFGSGDAQRSAAGEISGAHPIAPPAPSARRFESDGAGARSSFPPDAGDAFAAGAEAGASQSSRPVTATQYPSHRPRQRMGLTSATPGTLPPPREAAYGSRDGAAYAAVPSWSADSERRVSTAPPPLPLSSIDDYDELEAEPDEESADDPGSVWAGGGLESWRAPEGRAESARESSAPQPAAAYSPATLPATGEAVTSSGASAAGMGSSRPAPGVGAALPPPLPPRGAYSDDDGDFGLVPEVPTLVMPSPEESEERPPSGARDARRVDVWDRESRLSGWDQDSGASWATELRNPSWSAPQHRSSQNSSLPNEASQNHSLQGHAPGSASSGNGLAAPNGELGSSEPPPPSDATPPKLTARVHHQAVRVSFAPDVRVPGQYVVRALREGEKAATGERVALLVALEPGTPLV